MHYSLQNWIVVAVVYVLLAPFSNAAEIRIENLDPKSPPNGADSQGHFNCRRNRRGRSSSTSPSQARSRTPNRSPRDTTTYSYSSRERAPCDAAGNDYSIEPETIALPSSLANIAIEVAEGETLHFVRIRKQLSAKDLQEIEGYSARSNAGVYFTKFSDCQAYTEAIKSPKTVSRTVLPKAMCRDRHWAPWIQRDPTRSAHMCMQCLINYSWDLPTMTASCTRMTLRYDSLPSRSCTSRSARATGSRWKRAAACTTCGWTFSSPRKARSG